MSSLLPVVSGGLGNPAAPSQPVMPTDLAGQLDGRQFTIDEPQQIFATAAAQHAYATTLQAARKVEPVASEIAARPVGAALQSAEVYALVAQMAAKEGVPMTAVDQVFREWRRRRPI